MKKRVNWYEYILTDPVLCKEFLIWQGSKKRKVRSIRKLASLFIRSKYGLDWMRFQIEHNLVRPYDEMVRIAKTKMFIFED